MVSRSRKDNTRTSTARRTDVVQIQSTDYAFAAIRKDGSVALPVSFGFRA